ncbi:MAG TPA: MBL fold metallo-hydrolase [Anaerolineales bacterium]|nr:MBL fold metallo-hydrolase [Anaerolineales bacterium]
MNKDFKIKFWGVRGSYPTPGASTVQYGGNTACVEINAGGCTIILDAGTGIIPLGRNLAKQQDLELLILLSHLHHDHTQGFPFFVPAYMPKARLHIYGPGGTDESVRQVLEQNQSSDTFPVSLRDMASNKDIQSLRESQIILWDEEGVRVVESAPSPDPDAVVVRIQKSNAHPGGVYHYRITYHGKSVVYATDTEGYAGTDRKLVNFARNADVLIHDAQYSDDHYYGCLAGFPSTQGYGHSTAAMAGQGAASAETGQLVLFHHDPSYADNWVAEQEQAAQVIFPDSHAAVEGMVIILSRSDNETENPGTRWTSEVSREREVKYASYDRT